tara:strand:- start:315 stop:623 length:309 start_codon:yes stop_codon:yes gene_type:complete
MAKRKTPKTVDLKPKAEKITKEQLQKVQVTAEAINKIQMEVGMIESRKHHMLHNLFQQQSFLEKIREEFIKEYGTDNVNMVDGTIKYNEDGSDEINPKDNSR